ncbi:MAG: DegT/DnrJ/EryC1/StrS family aminotransferase [Gammaproteobacteria bacterium]
MSPRPFTGGFTQQEPIPEQAIERAVAVLRSGRLHRYNTVSGETAEASLLEVEFARYQGRSYCLACASGGYALQTALRASGLSAGDKVLTNAFTLAPVPGAIVSAGGVPVFVETSRALVPDLDDLRRKIESSGARFLMLSLMRGHLPDMDALMTLVDDYGLLMIEDCAHTMGAAWRGRKSGNFGHVGCFSTQTYKHLNSGEGGLLVTDDEELMARAVMLSGSYMLFDRHEASPPPEVFERIRFETPNCSGRMDNLRAAILRPQLEELDSNAARWNERYRAVEALLRQAPGIQVIERPAEETFVGSSIQFLIPGIAESEARAFLAANAELGVELKWFGDDNPVGFTSKHSSWKYLEPQSMPLTDQLLSELFDMRIPLTFSLEDCAQVGEIIRYTAEQLPSVPLEAEGRV